VFDARPNMLAGEAREFENLIIYFLRISSTNNVGYERCDGHHHHINIGDARVIRHHHDRLLFASELRERGCTKYEWVIEESQLHFTLLLLLTYLRKELSPS
jgi:hypothetical protein